ncbi:MAG: hypothetical protein ABS36_14945 [Acidobacteria bacterium SCN 69-37]|nr:MAG: hypothetical protein ABS36_14945 [Acidobacteria bacterium SCN 69-37]
MPDVLPFLCRQPGCQTRVHAGYCPAHQQQRPRRQHDRERGNSTQRGYTYRWQQYRLRRLRETPYCEDCDAAGFVALATEVHHVVKLRDRPDLQFVDANTRCLCQPCHSRRTAHGE